MLLFQWNVLSVPCDTPYKSYLLTFCDLKFHFFKDLKITLWLIGKFQNAFHCTIKIRFQPKWMWTFPVTVLANVTYCDFDISNFKCKREIELFLTWDSMWKWKSQNATLPTVMILIQLNSFWMTALTTIDYRKFEDSNIFSKKIEI